MSKWLKKIFGGSSDPSRVSTDTSSGGAYSGLRNQALMIQRNDTGITSPSADAPIWGLLMETGYPGATATLVALSDGTSSLYVSNGGGVIGGQAHESVRHANAVFIEIANQYRHHLELSKSFPVPGTGQTVFYALTDSGILTGGGNEEELGNGRHELSTLFHAGHGVLTELRLINENPRDDA